jgi:predicted nuclease of predicted toxin-antitoxin system
VKFLVDNQLPVALAHFLNSQGLDCQHVHEVGLDEATDAQIWNHVVTQQIVVITKDEDFVYFANQTQPTAQVVWVRLGNCRKEVLLAAFGQLLPQILESLKAGNRVVEIR